MDMSGPIGEIGVPTGVLAVEMVSEAEFHALLAVSQSRTAATRLRSRRISTRSRDRDWLRGSFAVEWAPEHDFEVRTEHRIYYVRGHIYPGCDSSRLPSDFASHTHNDSRAEKWASPPRR